MLPPSPSRPPPRLRPEAGSDWEWTLRPHQSEPDTRVGEGGDRAQSSTTRPRSPATGGRRLCSARRAPEARASAARARARHCHPAVAPPARGRDGGGTDGNHTCSIVAVVDACCACAKGRYCAHSSHVTGTTMCTYNMRHCHKQFVSLTCNMLKVMCSSPRTCRQSFLS